MRARSNTGLVTARCGPRAPSVAPPRSGSYRSLVVAGGLLASCALVSADTYAAAPITGSSSPSAATGRCLAEAEVPRSRAIEPSGTERRAANVRFEITPARFGPRARRVVVREAATRLRVVPPVLASETRARPLAPATTRWVRDGLDGELPIAAGDRLDLIAAGVELEAVAPGTCYVEHVRPARIGTTTERVLVREAGEQLAVLAAKFETVRRSIVTRPAHTRLIEVPAVRSSPHEPGRSGSAADGAVVREATVTRVREPAILESVEVHRLLADAVGVREPESAVWDTVGIPHVERPASYVWHVDRGGDAGVEPPVAAALPTLAPEGTDVPTGRRLCHRHVPATAIEYERLVVREEGRFEREPLPAEHVVLDVQALLDDARSERVEVPAVAGAVERHVRERGPETERGPVPCGTDLAHGVVLELQQALAREGFPPGAFDGELGPDTLGAVVRYQEANGLASGELTVETMEALGIEP